MHISREAMFCTQNSMGNQHCPEKKPRQFVNYKNLLVAITIHVNNISQ